MGDLLRAVYEKLASFTSARIINWAGAPTRVTAPVWTREVEQVRSPATCGICALPSDRRFRLSACHHPAVETHMGDRRGGYPNDERQAKHLVGKTCIRP